MGTLTRSLAVSFGCLYAAAVPAGEIIIVDPAAQKTPAERAKDKARQEAGRSKGDPTIIVIDDGGKKKGADAAEASLQDARDYVRPAPADPAAAGGTTIILRSAPQSDAEKAKLRARSYTAPAPVVGSKDCRNTTVTQVGTIGDAPATTTVVVEKGNSSVNVQCK